MNPEIMLRKLYNIVVSFNIPSPNTVTLAATSREEAIRLACEQLKEFNDLKIIDCYPVSDVPEMYKDMEQAEKIINESVIEEPKVIN